jgi:hypothetical protein
MAGRAVSAYGTKRTSQSAELMSAFGAKADIVETALDVLKPLLTALANKPPVHLLPSCSGQTVMGKG